MKTNKAFKTLFIIILCAIITSVAGALLQIKKNNDTKHYFSNNTSIPEINIKKEAIGKYRTSVDYKTVYSKQNISSSRDAVALIKKDSNIQKEKCDKSSVASLEDEIERKYDIDAVNLCELDTETVQSIMNVMDRIYTEFPNTRGFITNLSLVNNEDTTGYIVAFMPSFAFATSNTLSTYPTVKKTQVLFNASYFLNLTKLKASIRSASRSGWFAPNASVESLIAHEFGHYLSFLVNINEYKMDGILLIKKNKSATYNRMLSNYNNGKNAQKIIKEAYDNYKKDTGSNISLLDFRRSISEYAVAVDNNGNYIYDETIAEAMDDYYSNLDEARDASVYIINVLKKKL